MKRITISLPDDLAELLADDARRLHQTVSEVVRAAVAEHLGCGPDSARRVIPFAGLGRSGRGDISDNFDEYLDEAMRARLSENAKIRS
jgi:Arc/MetJ-type ribon-helix-helix transcriptional regulator